MRRPLADEVLVHGRGGEQRGNRQQVGRHLAIGHDQDVVAQVDGVLRRRRERRERRFHAVRAPRGRIADVELEGLERAAGEQRGMPDLLHRAVREDRLLRFEAHRQIRRVRGDIHRQQVRPRADERDERHHELFADRIDRRIGHLGEQLLEVVVEHLRAAGTAPAARHRCPSTRSPPRLSAPSARGSP